MFLRKRVPPLIAKWPLPTPVSSNGEVSCVITVETEHPKACRSMAYRFVQKYLTGVIAVAVFIAFFCLAEDSSCLFTLASAFQLLGVRGLFDSHQSLHTCTAKLVICSWFFRIVTILITNGYTPIDATGDWLHTLLEVMCLLCMIGAYMKHLIYGTSASASAVSVARYVEWFGTVTIVVLSLALGSYYNLGLVGHNRHGELQPAYYKYDILWAASVYIESVAFIPQVVHMTKTKQYLRQNAQFVSMSFIARACALAFWLLAVQDMKYSVRVVELRVPSTLIVSAQVIQLVSISHVTFFYIQDRLRLAAEIVMSNEFTCTMV